MLLAPSTTLALTSTWNHSKRPRNTRDMTTASSRSQESDGIRPFTFSKLVGLSDRCYRSTAVGQTVYYSVQVYTLDYRRRERTCDVWYFSFCRFVGQRLSRFEDCSKCVSSRTSPSLAEQCPHPSRCSYGRTRPGAAWSNTCDHRSHTSAARSGDRRAPTILPQSTRDI